MVNLKNFFEPKRIAVIGVSRNPRKVGYVIFKNILDAGFEGDVIPVNPHVSEILNHIVYSSVKKIKGKVDLAILAIPAEKVLGVVKECKSKGIKDVLIVSSGFSEVGNNELENKLKEFLKKNKMRCLGVNCLGVYDSYNALDTLFLPRYRLKRPLPGAISFVCQSGAVGSAILDIATAKGHKFSKFISYGNATDIDESDLIEYLGNDKNTKVICLYVEGIKDGEKFYKVLKKVSEKKPIIALKGGLTEEGMEATLSHTGSLAGKKEVYFGIFKQVGIINADSLEEMFNIASLVEKNVEFKGNRLQIITNGGGYGIISTDAIVDAENIEMSSLSSKTIKNLRKVFPKTINVRNPLDLVGDATTERYEIALEACIKDDKVDGILLILLYQTPLITTDIVEVISGFHQETKKPIVVVSTGGEFTENLSESLEDKGVPVFSFPKDAIHAIDKLIWYGKKRKRL
ncbi:MAG: CoA-binding protein [Nanoarchaeota archaeon]|nr:CoA-binding protein [Nanoarchaeota archaeon]